MAIALLNVAPATGVRTVGTARPGTTGAIPLAQSAYDEGGSLTIPIADADVASDFVIGSRVVITSTPAQFVADGVITAIAPLTSATHRNVTVRIDAVTTARNTTSITALNLATLALSLTPVAHTALTAAQSGFVQAIYTGNNLSSNAHERGLIASFGPSVNSTSYPLRPGVVLPEGAVITNSLDERFNILINQ